MTDPASSPPCERPPVRSAISARLGSALLVLAGLGAVALGLTAQRALPGCGADCSALWQGRYSHLGGYSVAWLGALIYFTCAVVSRVGWLGWALRAAILAAAVWFIGVQVLAGQFCPLCCAVHAVAAVGAMLVKLPATRPRRWLAVLPGLAAVALLAAVQTQQPEPLAEQLVATIHSVPEAAASTAATNGFASKVRLHGGQFSLSRDDFPCLGSSAAEIIAVAFTDYTCGHCYHLKKVFAGAIEQSHGRLGVLLLPASRNDESRDVQRFMRALWLVDKKGYAAVDAMLASDKLQATRPAVREAVAKQLGGEAALAAVMQKQGAAINITLTIVDELLTANEKAAGTRNLPQYIASDKVYVGAPNEVSVVLAQALGEYFDDPHPLVFEVKAIEMGRVAAGTMTNYGLVMKNRGTTPIAIREIHVPEGITVSATPSAPIQPHDSAQCLLRLSFPTSAQDFDWRVDVALDGDWGTRTVHVKGSTWSPWKLSAESFAIHIAPGAEAADSPTLGISLADPLVLSLPVPAQPQMQLKLERGANAKAWKLITTPAITLAPGQYSGTIPIAVASTEPGQMLPAGWPPAFSVPYTVTVSTPASAKSLTSEAEPPASKPTHWAAHGTPPR